MKTEDLKNYIFEQCLTEKMHPLVMRGAQWVADQIGGDAKKLARRMSTGIKRTTTEPTPEHVYNAAQFHFGEILRKNSPSMDRPEIYADMRTRLRAHLGLDGEVNETSDALKQKLEDGRYEQAIRSLRTGNDIRRENLKMSEKTGRLDPSLTTVADIMSDKGDKATKSYLKANNRRKGRRGDGSERTSKQESAFNFINGLKRLTETSDALKQKLEDGRREQAMKAYDTSNDIFKEWEKIYKRTGKIDQNLDTVRKFMGDKATTLMASVKKVRNRRIGLKGDGSPR